MLQVIVLVGFFMIAIGVFAAALQFSKYKKRENAGCCGGGHCSDNGTPHTCYSSKSDFVDNYEKIKTEKLELKN